MKKAEAFAPTGPERILAASYQVAADRFLVTFDSGKEYGFARSLLELRTSVLIFYFFSATIRVVPGIVLGMSAWA